MWTGVVQARFERMVRAAQAVDRQRGGEIGRAREALGAEHCQRGDGGRRLRAVDQREPLLRAEVDRRQAGTRERRGAVEHGGIVAGGRQAFADQDQRQVRERREVAAGPDRAAARHDRVDARVQHGDQQIQRRAPDARESLRQHVRAKRHHRAYGRHAQRRVDARRVAPQQIALQLAERALLDLDFGERSEAGVDAVDRRVSGGVALDDGARRVDAARGLRRERHRREIFRDRQEIRQGE